MSAVVRPTDAARGGNNNSIIRAAPAAAAAHHCFTITPPLGSLGATDGHCSQIGLFFLSFPSQVNHIEGGVRLQSCSLLAYFLLILASFPRGHSRTNVVAPSRDTATDGGDERARACASRRRRRRLRRRRCSGGMEEILSRRLANLRQGTLGSEVAI